MDEVTLKACYQPDSPGRPSLGEDDLHVWAVPLLGGHERYVPLLSTSEQAKAERLRFADHRRRFTIWTGALRAILAGYADTDPADLEFSFGPRGKPCLARERLAFNLTHSGQLALVAVGRHELGIDCEKVRHLESLEDIARRHFSAVEFDALAALAEEDKLQGFYRCWTRKEAWIKAVGAGLTLPLDVFDVSIGDDARFLAFRDGREDPTQWSLFDVSPAADYVGALAAHGRGFRLHTFVLQAV